MVKVIFDIVNYEAASNVLELKKQLYSMEIKTYGKNVKPVLTSTHVMCFEILQEGGNHDNHIDNFLASPISIDITELKLEIILTKSKRFRRREH